MLVLVAAWVLAMQNDIDRLAAQLRGDVPQARRAAESLATRAEAASPAAVELVDAAGHTDEGVRESAVAALERLGPPAPGDCAALVSRLGADAPETAYWAATLLGRLREGGFAAVGGLAGVLADARRPVSVRERAAWALGRIGRLTVDARAALRRASAGDEPRLARLARQALDA